MSSTAAQEKASPGSAFSRSAWLTRLIIALTVLACIAIAVVALYAISLISEAIIILLVSALGAYLIHPFIDFLQRFLPRPLAILVAYLVVVSVVAVALYLLVISLIQQLSSLVQSIQFLLSPAGERQLQPLIDLLQKSGITNDQIAMFRSQAFAQLQAIIAGLLPFLLGTFNNVILFIVVVTLSIYFVIDGPRIIRWLRHKTPQAQRGRINFLMHALDQSIGGYFRGALLLAAIGAVSTGVVLTVLRVPYAILLGVLFFLLFFVPVIGSYIIGALCILAAIPDGWVTMLIVAVFVVILQEIVMGQILSPRIFSRAVGIHPIVAIFALFAGGELFGVLGGLLSVPIAGVLQEIIIAAWKKWKEQHPEQFPPEEAPLQQPVLATGTQNTPSSDHA